MQLAVKDFFVPSVSTLLDWQYNNFLCVTIKKITSFNFCRETPKSEKKKKKKKKHKREQKAEDMDATTTSEICPGHHH